MNLLRLGKGQNMPIGASVLAFRLVTDPEGGFDTSALVLGHADKIRGEADFVFYNQPSHPSGAARHFAVGAGDAIEVVLGAIEPDVDRILITASVDAGSISRYHRAALMVRDIQSDADVCEIGLVCEGSESALVLAEVYRRADQWKLRAVSQGYATGLAGLATDYGIHVANSNQSPVASEAPQHQPAREQPAHPQTAPVPVVSDEERVRVRSIMREYAQNCDEVLELCNQTKEVAMHAVGARRAADERPQHEISIRNFENLAAEKLAEFNGLFAAFESARRRTRDVGSRIHEMGEEMDHPFDPEMTLLMVLDGDELYGAAATGSVLLRSEFAADPESYMACFRAVVAAIEADTQADSRSPFDLDFPGYIVTNVRQRDVSFGVL